MPCPECQKKGFLKVLFGGLNFEGKSATDRLECPKCGSLFSRQIYTKVVVKLIKIGILAVLIIGISGTLVWAHKIKNNCASFQTRIQAQKMFDSNPDKYGSLDKNHDHIVCQDYKYK